MIDREKLAARLRATFATELEDQLRGATECLLALEQAPGDAEQLRSLFRVMHTLKGAAHATGVLAISQLCHTLETLLAEARDSGHPLGADDLRTLFAGVDMLTEASARLNRGEEVTELSGGPPLVDPPQAPAFGPIGMETTVLPPAVAAVAAARGAAIAPEPSRPVREAAVRVAPERLDMLLGASNRLLIAASRGTSQPETLESVRESAARALTIVRRARRERQPDGLASVDDTLTRIVAELGRLTDEATNVSREVTRVSGEIATGIRELRLRPFADAVEGLPRLIRDLAAETGKEVQLVVSGEPVQADRAVLDQIHEAILHLVRNAVDHGIESPGVRRSRGKPETGTIRVAAEPLGDRMVVRVADDGGGLDVAALRVTLEARGERPDANDRTVARRLFSGGVSTRATASAISGRGVGLDAVRAAMERVRGSVDVSWVEGRETVFTLEAPVTMATVRVVLATVGRLLIGIPTAYVERLVRVPVDEIAVADGRLVVRTGRAPVPVVSLASVLGPPVTEHLAEKILVGAVLLVGGQRLVVGLDELLTEAEVVVRPIHGQGSATAPHVSGAAQLASGRIALVLNATAVVSTGLALAGDAQRVLAPHASAPVRRRVLVVDDSITTRTLEQSVLEAAGYEVMTAVDGADGWRLLQERGAELVVADVEMPRMDGLELCATVRTSGRFKTLPFVLITGLETPEDRARGLEAGADAYLGKSSFEQQGLLDTVRDLIG